MQKFHVRGLQPPTSKKLSTPLLIGLYVASHVMWKPSMQKTKLGRTRERTSEGMPERNARTPVNELANWHCEVLELQMSSKIVLGSLWWLTEFSSFMNLRFLAFGSSEKDYPCNELSLYSFIIVSNFAWWFGTIWPTPVCRFTNSHLTTLPFDQTNSHLLTLPFDQLPVNQLPFDYSPIWPNQLPFAYSPIWPTPS